MVDFTYVHFALVWLFACLFVLWAVYNIDMNRYFSFIFSLDFE